MLGSLFPYDQYLSAYVLEWGRHVLWTDPSRVFDTPICHPAPLSLASTEHLIGFAPLYALGRLATSDPLTAYHLLLLAVFLLNGLAMAALVRAWTSDDHAAVLAGACFAFAPCQLAFGAWIHVLATFCLPLLLLGLDATLWGAPRRGAVVLALAVAWQITLTVYGTAFGLIVGAVFLGVQLAVAGPRRPWRRLLLVGAAVAASTPLLALIASPYVATSPLAETGHAALGTRIIQQSAGMIPFDPLGDGPELLQRLGRATGLSRSGSYALDGGRVTMMLAAIGIVLALVRRTPTLRRRVTALVALVVVGVLLALGPGFVSTPLGMVPLPLVLLDELPVVGGLRFAERFVVIAAIGLAACAGIAFAEVLRGRPRWLRLASLAVLLALVHWDAPPLAFRATAGVGPVSPAAEWLRVHGQGVPVLEWPPLTTACEAPFVRTPATANVATRQLAEFLGALKCFGQAARHTLENTWHWQPTTLCFTSHPPSATDDLARALLSATDPREFAGHVARAGIGRLLVHRSEGAPPAPAALSAAGFTSVADDGRDVLYVRDVDHPAPAVPSRDAGLSITLPRVVESGVQLTATIRLTGGTSTTARTDMQDGPATSVWVGWRTADGARVLPLDAERAARLEALPTRWRAALSAAYSRDRRAGPGGGLAPGETRTVRVVTVAPPVPGPYRVVATTGVGSEAPDIEHESASLAIDVVAGRATSGGRSDSSRYSRP